MVGGQTEREDGSIPVQLHAGLFGCLLYQTPPFPHNLRARSNAEKSTETDCLFSKGSVVASLRHTNGYAILCAFIRRQLWKTR